jgi:hypothetical protein
MKLDGDKSDDEYQTQVKLLNAKIEKHSHDLKFYETTKQILYEDNFLLKKKLNENLNYDEKTSKQLKKYQRIHQNAERTHRIQKNLQKEMQKFDNFTSKKFLKEEGERRGVWQKLHFDVEKKKGEIVQMQKDLDSVKYSIQLKEAEIKSVIQKNEKYHKENKSRKREYYIIKNSLHQIYEQLDVSDLESVLLKFRELSIQYEGKQSLVIYLHNYNYFLLY